MTGRAFLGTKAGQGMVGKSYGYGKGDKGPRRTWKKANGTKLGALYMYTL